MEIGGKSQHGNIWCVSYRFSLILFAKYNLISLRNMPTKFRKVAPSGCEVVWKLVENLSMEISGAFLIGFPCFFFAKYNLFSLRNMPTKFREATLSHCKVVWKLVENVSMAISGAFLTGFL